MYVCSIWLVLVSTDEIQSAYPELLLLLLLLLLFGLPPVADIEDGEDTGLGLFGDMDPVTDRAVEEAAAADDDDDEEYLSFCWCLLVPPPPPLGGEEDGEVGARCDSSANTPSPGTAAPPTPPPPPPCGWFVGHIISYATMGEEDLCCMSFTWRTRNIATYSKSIPFCT